MSKETHGSCSKASQSTSKKLSLSLSKRKQTSLSQLSFATCIGAHPSALDTSLSKGKQPASSSLASLPRVIATPTPTDMPMDTDTDTDTPKDMPRDTDTDAPTPKDMPRDTDTDTDTPIPTKKSIEEEDIFSEAQVKQWQLPRIKAWESRRSNPEAYAFRLTVPGVEQRKGPWDAQEHALFMQRCQEWKEKTKFMGSSWGLFSLAFPHRVGYQCMNYYRRLVCHGTLIDDAYTTDDGKIRCLHKSRFTTLHDAVSLGPEWETEKVKAIEKNVDLWIRQYHCGIVAKKTRPTPTTKKKVPTAMGYEISEAFQRQGEFKRKRTVQREEHDLIAPMETAEPEQVHPGSEPRSEEWGAEWNRRLVQYNVFMEPFLDTATRNTYWRTKQRWRQGLATTEMLLVKKSLQKPVQETSEAEKPTVHRTQASLSRFFVGVKKLKVDTPEELVSSVRIPNDLFSGVKQIIPLALAHAKALPNNAFLYYKVDSMMESIDLLNTLVDVKKETSVHSVSSSFEGILVDPPWEFYVCDGRNDGQCCWNLKNMSLLMESVLDFMTAGLIFIWTHKQIQPQVVRLMASLNCKYVENLIWFKKSINNVPIDQPSPYISSTKEILLIFKKGEGFELRHQRSADVVIDFELPRQHWIEQDYTEPKPTAVYEMIETLLPKAGYQETLGRGRLLELWAKKTSPRRKGWISICQNKPTSHGIKTTPTGIELAIREELNSMTIEEKMED